MKKKRQEPPTVVALNTNTLSHLKLQIILSSTKRATVLKTLTSVLSDNFGTVSWEWLRYFKFSIGPSARVLNIEVSSDVVFK